MINLPLTAGTAPVRSLALLQGPTPEACAGTTFKRSADVATFTQHIKAKKHAATQNSLLQRKTNIPIFCLFFQYVI
jgi:hypothetical protein